MSPSFTVLILIQHNLLHYHMFVHGRMKFASCKQFPNSIQFEYRQAGVEKWAIFCWELETKFTSVCVWGVGEPQIDRDFPTRFPLYPFSLFQLQLNCVSGSGKKKQTWIGKKHCGLWKKLAPYRYSKLLLRLLCSFMYFQTQVCVCVAITILQW